MINDPSSATAGGLLSPDTLDAAARGALKASPAGGVVFWHYVADKPIEFWVSVAVLVYTLLQIVVLARREFFRRKEVSK